jgi:glycosyltransferase involved in cell wall biosynthesis
MKIIIIGQKGIPAKGGGVERHVEELSTRLVKAGHEVSVFTRPNYTDKKLTSYQGVNLISIPSLGTKHLDAISHTFLASLHIIFKGNYDVAHFHAIGPCSLIWLVKIFRPKLKIISTFHCQDYYHQKWNGLAKAYLKFGEYVCCKSAHKTIVVSQGLKAYAENKYKKSFFYIPNGVNIEARQDAKIIRENWGLEANSYILATSRLVRHKGLHYLIKAYKELNTDKKLVIAGGSAFTEDYISELHKMAENNPNIIFTGNQTGNTLKELYSNASIFVQPSESEGLSIALLEAMSYGLPVIVSDIPENIEVIKNSALSFQSKNYSDLKVKMEYLLANEKIGLELGENAKKIIFSEYNWEKITDETIKIYNL